jgi:hypothetical protein
MPMSRCPSIAPYGAPLIGAGSKGVAVRRVPRLHALTAAGLAGLAVAVAQMLAAEDPLDVWTVRANLGVATRWRLAHGNGASVATGGPKTLVSADGIHRVNIR